MVNRHAGQDSSRIDFKAGCAADGLLGIDHDFSGGSEIEGRRNVERPAGIYSRYDARLHGRAGGAAITEGKLVAVCDSPLEQVRAEGNDLAELIVVPRGLSMSQLASGAVHVPVPE